MIPILHSLHSPDLLDLRNGAPVDPCHFSILVQAFIGPSQGIGYEAFDFLVCTSSWIQMLVAEQRFLFGRAYLIVEAYDYNLIYGVIESLCQRTSGDNWGQIAEKLSRFGKWEFDDYVES